MKVREEAVMETRLREVTGATWVVICTDWLAEYASLSALVLRVTVYVV